METNRLGHKIMRTFAQFNLCVDESAGYPVYYIENSILTEHTKGKGMSYTFSEERALDIMRLNDIDFIQIAKQSAGNDIYCQEVIDSKIKGSC
jgi:hypothetical protein